MSAQIPSLILVAALFSAPLHAAQEERYPGYGVVESVTAVTPVAKKPADESASAGSSAPARKRYRVRVRMDDGRTQVRDIPTREFAKGDRVLLTNAGDVVPD
jgi:hypothetical protein